MKYGETIFDTIYLLFTIISGIYILIKGKHKIGKIMGISALILGLGDAFHLVPRMLNYFIEKDFNFYLGLGKMITSITMTIFYLFLYYIYVLDYKADENKKESILVWILVIIRIVLCLLPQNKWLTNESPLEWGIIRNIPFLILGIIMIIFYSKEREQDKYFRFIYILILLSFLFYVPVVGAEEIPMLGMLMLPKTICYVLIVVSFLVKTIKGE